MQPSGARVSACSSRDGHPSRVGQQRRPHGVLVVVRRTPAAWVSSRAGVRASRRPCPDESSAGAVGQQQAVRGGQPGARIFESGDPFGGRRSKAGAEECPELDEERAVPSRAPDDPRPADVPGRGPDVACRRQVAGQGGDLAVQCLPRHADVVDVVGALDDGSLVRRRPDQRDVDGARPGPVGVERVLRERLPSAAQGVVQHEAQQANVRVVARPFGAGGALHEGHQPLADRGGHRAPGLDGRRGAAAGFHLRDEGPGDARPAPDLVLGQGDAAASLAQCGAKTLSDRGRSMTPSVRWRPARDRLRRSGISREGLPRSLRAGSTRTLYLCSPGGEANRHARSPPLRRRRGPPSAPYGARTRAERAG